MGLGLNLLLFVGIPAVAIVALGTVLNFFREPILGGARATGEVFTSIFTEPVRAGVEQISTAFSDLPDIAIRVPRIVLDIPDIPNPFEGLFGNGSDTETPSLPAIVDAPGQVPGRESRVNPRDPVLDVTPELTLLPGSLPVSLAGGTQRISRSEIIEKFPDTLALFDVRATPGTEFLPFSRAGILSAVEEGLGLRVSGQIFQERPGLKVLLGAA